MVLVTRRPPGLTRSEWIETPSRFFTAPPPYLLFRQAFARIAPGSAGPPTFKAPPKDRKRLVHASPASAKTVLRLQMRGLRRGLARKTPDAGKQAARIAPDTLIGRFPVVAGYRAMGAEIDPLPLMRRLAEAGAQLALPVTLARDVALIFRAYSLGDPLVQDALGMPAPTPEAVEVEPDLFLTPLLAFDRAGGRIGQGGGFYDRTLAGLRARRAIFALGLAYAGQEVTRLPLEPHDQRLDAILTQSAYIEAQKEF